MYLRVDFIFFFVLLFNTAAGDPVFKDYVFSKELNASYKIYNSYQHFADAAKFCINEGASLLIPTSNFELNFLTEYEEKIKSEINKLYWIGVNNIADNKQYLPIDGTDPAKITFNWIRSTPSYTSTYCACLFVRFRQIWLYSCDYTHYFICKRSWGNSDFKEIEKPDFRNDYHYDIRLKNFYKWYAPMIFSDATSECMDDGATMLIPKSEEELTFASFYVDAYIYIGIHDMDKDGIYETIDGTDISKVYMTTYGIKTKSYDCVIFLSGNKFYSNVNCLDENYFACKISPNDIKWDNNCETYLPNFHYNNNTKRCYKYYSTPKDWYSAKERCESINATLIVVNDEKEAEFLLKTFLTKIPAYIESFHSGFEKQILGQFRNVDGIQGKLNVSSDCGLVDRDLRMKHHDCSNKLSYICEKSTSK